MDGLEVLQRIRALPDPYSANLPVIICSADTERSRVQACLAAGAQGVLPKPIRKEQLLAFLTGFPPPDQRTLATPLTDTAQVAQIRADLGPETWARGLHACRSSAETCLAELEDEARTAKALHRLAGLSSSYGMTGLHRLVRLAETQIAEGLPCPIHQLRTCCQASLEALENLEDSLRQASGTAASER